MDNGFRSGNGEDMCMAQFVSAGYIMAENLRKSRQNRIIDAYLHYRQEELLELASNQKLMNI